MKKLSNISSGAAIAFMVLCVFLGIFLGNRNALQKAVDTATLGFSEVKVFTDKRIGQASNLLTLATKYIPNDEGTKKLSSAIENAKKVTQPKLVMQADAVIATTTSKTYETLKPSLNDFDARLAIGVMDELSSVGKQIARYKKVYDEGFIDAQNIYNQLPTRWLLQNPEEALT